MKGKEKKRRKSKSRSRSRTPKKKGHHRSRNSSPHYSSYHSQSPSSRSRSRSLKRKSFVSSSSKSRSHSSNGGKKRKNAIEKNKKRAGSFERKGDDFEKQRDDNYDPKNRPRVNHFMLSGILLDQKKVNTKLDEEEVNKAQKQFKDYDKSERKATLLSNYINKTDEMTNKEEYFFDYVDGAYVKVLKPYICDFKKCGQRFRFHQEMNTHLENHLKDDRNNNNGNPNLKKKNTNK